MRAGQGTFRPGAALPVIPPREEDELISSWLDRTARFYGGSLQTLIREISCPAKPIELSAIDLGVSRTALAPIATLLGVPLEQVARHTIAATYPWASNLVARGLFVPDHHRMPRLRYAACPHCLEQQKAERGFSWLRRAWVFAPRTVCASHHVELQEGRAGSIVHAIWSDFLRKHAGAGQPVCDMTRSATEAVGVSSAPSREGPIALLHQQMAMVQDAMLADAARGQKQRRSSASDEMAVMASDLVWAFTRADRYYPDRLVYEAFASDLLDSYWHMVRRREPGPLDFTRMYLPERHTMLATVTVLLGPDALRSTFYRLPRDRNEDLATLHRRLRDADRAELAERQRRWSRTDEA